MAYGSSSLGFVYPKPASGLTGERLTVSSSPVQFANASTWQSGGLVRTVDVDIQSNDVWATFDGGTPSSSNGHRLYAGQNYTWSIERARAARFVRVSADATIQASPSTY